MPASNLATERDLPQDFVRNIIGIYGDAGVDWLRALPDLCEEVAARWEIGLLPAIFDLSFHYVVPGIRRDGLPVVLKLGVPDRALTGEAETLRAFAGRGAARLLETDSNKGALLIERILPGTTLTAHTDDEAATCIAARAMQALGTPPPTAGAFLFRPIADWAEGMGRHRARFDGGTGPLPAALFREAEARFAELLASSPAVPTLLHGDLHHGNLLDAGAGTYRAIDPHGVVGDPAFEPSAFLLNPAPQPAPVLARRLDIFAETLEQDRERIRGWAVARAVLSAVWTIEDGGDDWQGAIAVAERLSGLG